MIYCYFIFQYLGFHIDSEYVTTKAKCKMYTLRLTIILKHVAVNYLNVALNCYS